MKVTVKIEGRPFIVEVGDIYARPVVALVDGERFEVWPEGEVASSEGGPEEGTQPQTEAVTPAQPPRARVTPQASDPNQVTAPIPGVIISINVQPGETVTHGQELCVLEAMKMKNVIRATRAGEIAAVKVTVGQHVQHSELLIEFAE